VCVAMFESLERRRCDFDHDSECAFKTIRFPKILSSVPDIIDSAGTNLL
jgi:hypothetical protein